MGFIFLIVYLTFCLLVAKAAKNTAIGFLGVLLASIFLTPLLTAIMVLLLRKPKEEEWELDAFDIEEDY